MIAHQAEGEYLQIESLRSTAKKIKEILAIVVIKKNVLPTIAARGNMVNRVFELDSPRPCHINFLTVYN